MSLFEVFALEFGNDSMIFVFSVAKQIKLVQCVAVLESFSLPFSIRLCQQCAPGLRFLSFGRLALLNHRLYQQR